MDNNKMIISSAIIALGMVVMGWTLKAGIDNFTNKDRKVTVKGLAEKEVWADKVTWPIATKALGNDLPTLYGQMGKTQQQVKTFLLKNGVKEGEIQINAPTVIDQEADQYADNRKSFRYNITSVVTVTSSNVKLVRSIIARQGELLKQGVAVVNGGYDYPITYEYVSFTKMKPRMMQEAIENAQKTARQFAANSQSSLNKIVSADQGQFTIDNRDNNTPYIKKVRVVTTVTYSLKD